MSVSSEHNAVQITVPRSAFKEAIAKFSPGYFALVMGTGIISVGLNLTGHTVLSHILLWISAISYVVLWALYIWRAITNTREVLHDLRGPEMAFAYFTVVAGTNVLAVRVAQEGLVNIAIPLFFFAATSGSSLAMSYRGKFL